MKEKPGEFEVTANACAHSIFGIISLAGFFLVPALALYGIVAATIGWPETVGKLFFALPAIYFGWLILALLFLATLTTLTSKGVTKPSRWEGDDQAEIPRDVQTVMFLYVRYLVVHCCPFVDYLKLVPFFSYLIHRAYSPSVHIHSSVKIFGRILDPDITWIGRNVLMGERSRIVAHAVNMLPEGGLRYLSAPIRIGDNVTIGGDSLIEMGTSIGDGALVETRSHVKPHARIGAGEVWGGSPAKFRYRIGDEKEINSIVQEPEISIDEIDVLPELCDVIAKALHVPGKTVNSETVSEDLAEWDSLGQLAISAALFDQYALSIPVENTPALKSIKAISMELGAINHKGQTGDSADRYREELSDPEWLPLLDPAVAAGAMNEKKAMLEQVKVRVAATFTADKLGPSLESRCAAYGIDARVEFAGFDQVIQSLLEEGSIFKESGNAINVVLVQTEDLITPNDGSGLEKAKLMIEAVQEYVKKCHIPLSINDLPPILDDSIGSETMDMEELSKYWRDAIEDLPGVTRLNFSKIINDIGHTKSRDRVGLEASSIPYTPAVFQVLGIEVSRKVRALVKAPAKVMALDCDGTIWGGILGEDKMGGIQIGGEGSDCPFRKFQIELKKLREKGILLVLTSRNEWEDVEKVFREHPAMVLRLEDIAAHRVNWLPKAENLLELSEELGLALDSFVFVDDDPHERAQAKEILPDLHVFPMANQIEKRTRDLLKLWIFDGLDVTAEDQERTKMVQSETARRRSKEEHGGMDAYLAQLDLKVRVRKATNEDLPRVAQLVGKTNQFNLNLDRLPEDEIAKRIKNGDVRVCETWDRFGDYGLTGVAAIDRKKDTQSVRLDLFLLSCRALGRGVEDSFLAAISRELCSGKAECHLVCMAYKSGPRNAPIRAFLLRLGFKEETNPDKEKPTEYQAAAGDIAKAPSHVTLVD